MPGPISGLSFPTSVQEVLNRNPGQGGSSDFSKIFRDAVDKVEDFQKTADQRVVRFLGGEDEDLHSTILATQRADLAFELFQQVRNKVVQAYQEVMRMQI